MPPEAPSLVLRRLALTSFRNHAHLSAEIAGQVVLVTGANGVGKTNLLEAVSLLSPGRGLRGAKLAELGQRVPGSATPGAWAIAAELAGPAGAFTMGTGTPPDGPPERRVFRLEGEPLRAQSLLAERLAVVWLTPQMDRLFQEGASGRRRFLDRLVWALEPSHAREVAAHDEAMASRNRLLAQGRQGVRADPAWLAGLEDAMARHGVAVAAARRALVGRLNALLAAGGVTRAFPAATLLLHCPIAQALEAGPALAAEDALREGLAADRARDAAAGGAARGAHRADLGMVHTEKGVEAALCSTGEQKALLVSVVLAHAVLIAEVRGFAPLLLLDEVAAHLDEARRTALFQALAALPAQSFLTGTDPALFAPLAGLAQGFRFSAHGFEPDADFPVPNGA